MKKFAILSFALVTLLAAVALPEAAHAQSDPRAEAYELYQRGVQSYKDADYEQAVEHLEQAVEIHKNPVVYYNLSLAYSKLGRAEDAMEAAEMAASMEDEMPDGTALKNRARIQAYSASLAGEDVATNISEQQGVAARSPRLETDMSSVGWAGAAGAGLGAVLVGTALIMNGSIGRKIDNYEAALDAGEFNSANRLYDEINRQQTLASVTVLSGSALLIGGAGMILYDLYFLEEEPRARLGASVGPDSAAIDLRIRF
ncbi:MAG: hypothetical protein ACQEVA_07005 [Myxococcota bacterium]